MRLIRVLAAVLASLTLVGCGGGASDSVNPFSAVSTADETGSATATISGTPATSITVGTKYSFTPTASDSDGGALKFSIANAPAWATFNASTGQLSGSPTATNTGTTMNIVISVADGSATAALPAFSITVTGTSGSTTPGSGTATVSWVAPTENSNGTALTNLGGYVVYYGTDASTLSEATSVQVSNPSTLSYTIKGLSSGTWYFAVASYTTSGMQSSLSTISSKTI